MIKVKSEHSDSIATACVCVCMHASFKHARTGEYWEYTPYHNRDVVAEVPLAEACGHNTVISCTRRDKLRLSTPTEQNNFQYLFDLVLVKTYSPR